MSRSGKSSQPEKDRYSRVINNLQQELSQLDPHQLAYNTNTKYFPTSTEKGHFHITLWEQELIFSFPEFIAYEKETGVKLPDISRVLLMYYFNTADGTPTSNKWVSFSELKDGRFYNQAYQGYTGEELKRFFQDDLEGFKIAAKKSGGIHYSLGTASYSFRILPRVSLLVIFWLGDEDFPSSFQILFDASADHYLPTDGYAILGSNLTRKLMSEQ